MQQLPLNQKRITRWSAVFAHKIMTLIYGKYALSEGVLGYQK